MSDFSLVADQLEQKGYANAAQIIRDFIIAMNDASRAHKQNLPVTQYYIRLRTLRQIAGNANKKIISDELLTQMHSIVDQWFKVVSDEDALSRQRALNRRKPKKKK